MFNIMNLYNFLVKFKSTHDGNSPTIREIMEENSLKSTSHTSKLLRRLQAQNLINLDDRGRIYISKATWLPPTDKE
jgi:SOS-response transcriptional repressor LexA